MRAYFSMADDAVMVQMRADDGTTTGDFVFQVREGEDFAGISYGDLKRSGAGEIALDEDGRGTIVRTGAIDAAFAKPRRPEFRVALAKAVTAAHKDAVSHYRTGGHKAINAHLRGEAAPGHGTDVHDRITLLREAVGHGEVTRSGLVYRAVPSAEPDMADIDAKFGHVIAWRGFTSATHDEATARGHLGGKGALFRILLPQGSHALEYAQVSGEDDPDAEVILPAGARFAVREASTTKGITQIDLVMFKRGPHDKADED